VVSSARSPQAGIAQAIISRQADCVMTVRGNMPTLHKRRKELSWAAVPATSSVSRDHGRRARRMIKVALD
jgi:hypothetical protein